MGLTLTEPVTLKNALVVPNMYYGLVGNINLTKEYSKYFVRASFAQWASEQAREERKAPVGMKKVELTFLEPPTGNIYEMVYEELKKKVGEHSDII